MLKAGTYEFADDMCSDQDGSALCIDRNVTIEAEVAGSVVLDAKGARRVIYVAAAGRAELVGLSITGGNTTNTVRFLTSSIEPTCGTFGSSHLASAGGWHPHRRLSRSDRLQHPRQPGGWDGVSRRSELFALA